MTVLLPVRDEEANVLPCLDTLLAQTVRPRIRVIDDGSTDATASLVVARLAAAADLTLLPAGPLPAGWRGKLHAMAVGEDTVDTPWLLLTDADTRHHPEVLARSLAAARQYGLDAVSLTGTQEVHGLGENLLTPAVFALLDRLLGDWTAAARGGLAVASGQYILLRRAAWEACGGFAPIRNVGLDDVAIAARLAAHGFRIGFFRAPGLVTVRMYRGAREVARGWRRNLGGLLGARPQVVAATLAVLAGPPLAALLEILAGHPAYAAAVWAAGAAASCLWRRTSAHPPLYGLLYPLDALFLAAVLAQAEQDHRQGRLASWRGREMTL